jgi:RimJ/RimL family protein N-acetyltransferase
MVYKCKITEVMPGESKKSVSYTYFSDNNKLVGRITFTKKIAGKWKGWQLLSNVIIYPEFRGLKLCDKMFKCVLKKYANDKVYLTVHEDNIAAIKCYVKNGFKAIDKVKKNIFMVK